MPDHQFTAMNAGLNMLEKAMAETPKDPKESIKLAKCPPLPFPITGEIEAAIREADKLAGLADLALQLLQKIKKDSEDALAVVDFRIGHAVQTKYVKEMRHLKRADEQKQFLTVYERELVYNHFGLTDVLLNLWQTPEVLADDKAILDKYADAIDAPVGVSIYNREDDYSPVIEAGIKANQPT